MTQDQQTIRTLRQQIGWQLWLRQAVMLTAGFAFLFGTAVLVARAAWGTDRQTLAWGAMGLVPIVGLAWWMMARRMPKPAVLRAIVDRQNHAGGLVMAGEETELGQWGQRVEQARAPKVTWRGGRNWSALLLGAAFVGLAFGLPDSIASVMGPGDASFAHAAAEEKQEQIDALEEEEVLTSDEASVLEEKLEQIKNEARGNDPSKTWEALDSIQAQLDKAADEAAEEAIQNANTLTELEQLAEQIERALAEAGLTPEELAELTESGEAMDPQDLADAMRAASEMVEQAMEASEAFEELMDPALAEKLKELAKLDPQALREMGELDEQAIEQLNALAEAMKEMEADSLVRVTATGDVTVFDPDPTITLDDLKKGTMPSDPVAVRQTSGAVFKHDPTVIMSVDMSAFGEGERVVAMKDLKELAVYVRDEKARVDLAKLGAPDAEYVLVVEPDGSVRRFVYSQEECEQCAAAMGDPQEVFRMTAQAAKLSKQQIRELMERLEAQGIINAQQMAQCEGACETAGGGMPGRAGIKRGRGDAPMTWKDPSSSEGTKFDEQTLPPATMAAIRDSQIVGVSVGAPSVSDGDGASSSGALSGAAAGGGSANRQSVLPEHRGAVQRYFDRE